MDREHTEIEGLCKRGVYYYIDLRLNGKRYVKSTKTTQLNKAIKIKNDILAHKKYLIEETKPRANRLIDQVIDKGKAVGIDDSWAEHINNIKNEKTGWLYKMWIRARNRSQKLSFKYYLSFEELISLSVSCNGRCTITDIPLSIKNNRDKTDPYQPSLDRIDNDRGYSFDNCRIVCYCVNAALNTWGEEVLFRMARGLLYKRIFHDF